MFVSAQRRLDKVDRKRLSRTPESKRKSIAFIKKTTIGRGAFRGVKNLKKSNKNGCFLGWFEDSQDKPAEDAGLWLPITAEGSRDTNKTARLRTAVIQTKPHG
ncbi:MAG: hypothetical protein ACKN9S_13050 [Pirellula sp.]